MNILCTFQSKFSFGKHDNLNDIRYYLISLNLENRLFILFMEDIFSIDYFFNIPDYDHDLRIQNMVQNAPNFFIP